MTRPGPPVVVASTGKGTAVGHDGLRVRVEAATGELELDRFDAIVVVGGMGALSSLMNDAPLLALLRVAENLLLRRTCDTCAFAGSWGF